MHERPLPYVLISDTPRRCVGADDRCSRRKFNRIIRAQDIWQSILILTSGDDLGANIKMCQQTHYDPQLDAFET